MKILTPLLTLTIVISAFAAGDPLRAETERPRTRPATVVEYRFAGLTEYETSGSADYRGLLGFAAMNKICQDEFGPAARIATTTEAEFRVSDGVEGDPREAWLAPTQPVKTLPLADDYYPFDASSRLVGIATDDGPVFATLYGACLRYLDGTANLRGPISTPYGVMTLSSCDERHAVACSLPRRLSAN